MSRVTGRIIPILAVLAILGMGAAWSFRIEIQYYRNRALIDYAANRYRVPPALIAALIWQESRFNVTRRGKAGEIGLMQIMPRSSMEWAKAEHVPALTPDALFNPTTNVLAGTWYLARAIDRWGNQPDPLPFALAEYNAGRSNSLRWQNEAIASSRSFASAISYPSTRAYVQSILEHYRTFGHPWQRW